MKEEPDGMLCITKEGISYFSKKAWDLHLKEEAKDATLIFTPRFPREWYRPIKFLDKGEKP